MTALPAEMAWLHLDCCDSTQRIAREWLESLSPTHHDDTIGVLVSADRQTAGAGRQGRRWHNPPGAAVMLSFAVWRPADIDLAGLPMTVARTVLDTLHAMGGGEGVSLKQPNDLVVGHAKVGGVLVDSVTAGRAVVWLIAGVGLNLGGARFSVDGRVASSLEAETGVLLDPPNTLRQLGSALAPVLGIIPSSMTVSAERYPDTLSSADGP